MANVSHIEDHRPQAGEEARLSVGSVTAELPIRKGTIGPEVLDITHLYRDTGRFTYDPGFTSTAACESKITFIDGDQGILLYRGYPIEQLAEQGDFLETCYLLLYGELPTAAQKADFDQRVTHHTMVHEQMMRFYTGFRRDAHPMAVMVGVVGALSAFYHDSTDISDPYQRMVASIRMIAKMPTIAAFSYRHRMGLPYVYPNNDLSYCANFLAMVKRIGEANYKVNPVLERALEVLFILHADHEQNCSTSATRLVGSSEVDPFSAVAAGIAALYGPLHGGANEAALRMLREIGSVKKVPEFIAQVKSGHGKLMGFGHRVYKNYDPRATVIKRIAYEVFEVTGKNPLLEIALEMERIALQDEYFMSRKLYPNVDFYSGLIYQSMGFPVEMFPVLFAIPRTAGWVSQWEEMIQDPEQKIARPRQIFIGPKRRDYLPPDKRAAKAR